MLHTKAQSLPLISSLRQWSWAWSLPLDSCLELSGGLHWETARELQLVTNPRKEGKPSGMHCPDQLHIAQAPWQIFGTVGGLDLIHQALQSEASRLLFFCFQNLDSTEAQLDLLVTSKFGSLSKRTKVCPERHLPAALGLGTNKRKGMVSARNFLYSFSIPTVISGSSTSLDDRHLFEEEKENLSHSRCFGEPLKNRQPCSSYHHLTMQGPLGRNKGEQLVRKRFGTPLKPNCKKKDQEFTTFFFKTIHPYKLWVHL